jgi:lysophospholipase
MENLSSVTFPDIDDRFLPPHKWRWHHFKTPSGRKLRFGTAAPIDTVPKGVVILLPGRTEFIEKFFEVARTLIQNNYSFWMMDWYGHGRSDKPLSNKHKHHSYGFDHDVEDLHYFIMQYVKYASVHPEKGRLPIIMLSNSMGGTVGLQYLLKYPDIFDSATFCAPMVKIKGLPSLPTPLLKTVAALMHTLSSKAYAPGGLKDWTASIRENSDPELFTGDETRGQVHNIWCAHDTELQLGHITNGWLHHALKACSVIQNPKTLSAIETPCLFALGGKDLIIDNAAVYSATKKMDNTKIIEFEDGHHEILMETDKIRDEFFSEFFAFIEKYKPETEADEISY